MPTAFRVYTLLILPALLCAVCAGFAGAAPPLTFSITPPDVLFDHGVNMAPLRLTAEVLGAQVTFAKKTATVTRNGQLFSCTMHSTAAIANGQPITLVKPPLLHGELYVPIRPLVTALQGKITFDPRLHHLIVTLPDLPAPLIFSQFRSSRVYESFTNEDPTLYVMNLDGSGLRRLSCHYGGVYEPALSPDGKRMVYLRDGDLYLRAVDSPYEQCLLHNAHQNYSTPRFTPDGKYILYQKAVIPSGNISDDISDIGAIEDFKSLNADKQIFRLCTDGSGKRLLGSGGVISISADGKTIAYQDWADRKKGTTNVCLMDIDGSHRRVVGPGENPVISADNLLLYTRTYAAGMTQWVSLPLTGLPSLAGAAQPAHFASEQHGQFSRDGRLITYARGGIAVMQADCTAPRQLTTSDYDSTPSFTPDGTRIIFLRKDQNNDSPFDFETSQTLMSVSADGSDDELPLTDGLEIQDYYLAPDGKQILFTARKPVFGMPDALPTELKASAPAYTLGQAQGYLRQVLPLVEAATGRKVKATPIIKLVTRGQMREVLSKELLPQMAVLAPGVEKKDYPIFARRQAEILSAMLLGKFGINHRILYLLPGNLQPLLTLGKVDAKYNDDILRVIIAHELTHGVQDQEVGLEKLIARCDNMEKALATNATIEGHAMFIEDQVADQLKVGEAEKEMARLIALGDIELKEKRDALTRLKSTTLASVMKDIYLGGRDFIAWQAQHSGTEKVWQVVANPPQQTEVIFHPETYSDTVTASIDYAAPLKGLETRFGKRKWTVQNMEVGELGLRAVYAGMDAATREKILGYVKHAQSLLATNDEGTMGNVTIVILRDAAQAPPYVAAVEKMSRDNIEKLGKSKLVTIKDFSLSDFTPFKGDVARKLTFTVEAQGMKAPVEIVRVARGAILLEICLQKLPFSDKQITAIIEEVFTRLAPSAPATPVGAPK